MGNKRKQGSGKGRRGGNLFCKISALGTFFQVWVQERMWQDKQGRSSVTDSSENFDRNLNYLQEPDESLEEKTRYKLPNIASELITCDVPQVSVFL